MILKKSTLGHLADMICGDVAEFPYRSSSYITRFFQDLDLNYFHDGSTRRWWTLSVLEEINKSGDPDSKLPNVDLVKIIEHLMLAEHFIKDERSNKTLALQRLNDILKSYELKVVLEKRTENPKLINFFENLTTLITDHEGYKNSVICSPLVFKIPNIKPNNRLVALIMPFSAEFNETNYTIKNTCETMGLACKRADDIWKNSEIIQDVFDLIFEAGILIADYTTRNSNVFYEVALAHLLGKPVIPITQSINDVPFDLRHHRTLKYLPNNEGLYKLKEDLSNRLQTLISENDKIN